jgi:pimeloyl-ACP methyl ester carboxylesterase
LQCLDYIDWIEGGIYMPTNREIVAVGDMKVSITRDPDKPLILLVRMAAVGMGLWDKIWDRLAEYYTVASFDLTAGDIDRFDSARDIFQTMAKKCVNVAQGLGYERFHFFGWTGGAQVAMRCLVDFPEHLHSCTMMGPIYNPSEMRPAQKALEILKVILDRGDLELYTYYWMMTSFSPDYAQDHSTTSRPWWTGAWRWTGEDWTPSGSSNGSR